ncbi:MAG TPA: stage II sporulation protein M [Sedimenticola sp.]|nr:stage II sporulation protein M [Sedimenticola sp.]
MRQAAFEQRHQPLWDELRLLLDDMERPPRRRQLPPEKQVRLPWLYRQVCNHYAQAGSRCYSPALVRQLHALVLRAYRLLYRQGGGRYRLSDFLGQGFPQALRRNARYFWLALLLFLVPALVLGIACYQDPELVYSVMDESQVAQIEAMYDPLNRRPGREQGRSSDTDFQMFGYYIANNIGIGFRTFAGGILAGVGTLLLLLYNGVILGGVAGHLTRLGYQETFWSFVAGHGAFELTAIVICGAAGLVLAHAIIAPGQLRRLVALKRAAGEALKLVMGAAAMLLVAAFIEAFWSSSGVPAGSKYLVAGLLWVLVVLYLTRAGAVRHGPG